MSKPIDPAKPTQEWPILNSTGDYPDGVTTCLHVQGISCAQLQPILASLVDLEELWLEGFTADGWEELFIALGQLPRLRHLILHLPPALGLPNSVACLQKLQFLQVKGAQLLPIPAALCEIQSLVSLEVDAEDLALGPPLLQQLGRLTNLQELLVHMAPGGEQLGLGYVGQVCKLRLKSPRALPFGISQLTGLEELSADLRNSPMDIVEILKALQAPNLRVLDLCGIAASPALDKVLLPASLQVLTIRASKLGELPKCLPDCRELVRLTLEECGLRTLPSSAGNWWKLESLHLQGNALRELPLEMAQLTLLQELGLARNQFFEIPSVAFSLPCLRKLNLERNYISRFKLPSHLELPWEQLNLCSNLLLAIDWNGLESQALSLVLDQCREPIAQSLLEAIPEVTKVLRPGRLRQLALGLIRGDAAAIAVGSSIDEWIPLLNFPNPYLQIQALAAVEQAAEGPWPDVTGYRVAVLGQMEPPTLERLQGSLELLQVTHERGRPAPVDIVILAQAPGNDIEQWRSKHTRITTPEQFILLANRRTRAQRRSSPVAQENLLRLLRSEQEDDVLLGLSLAKGLDPTQEILGALLAIALVYPGKDFQKQAKEVCEEHLSTGQKAWIHCCSKYFFKRDVSRRQIEILVHNPCIPAEPFLRTVATFGDHYEPLLYPYQGVDHWRRAGENGKSLKMDHLPLLGLPNGLLEWSDLEELILPKGGVGSIPESIGRLKGLRMLTAIECSLSELPDTLSSLPCLETLRLQVNRFHKVPSVIKDIPQLAAIHLSFNPIAELPDWMGACANLRQLTMGNCLLEGFPKAILDMEGLEQLEISFRQPKFPDSLASMKALRVLKLLKLPFEALPSGLVASSLRELVIQDWKELAELPAWLDALQGLEVLSLEGCRKLKALPSSIGALHGLQKLNLSDTTLTDLPSGFMDLRKLQALALPATIRLETADYLSMLAAMPLLRKLKLGNPFLEAEILPQLQKAFPTLNGGQV